MLEMQRAFLDWLAREIAEALADELAAEPIRERTTLTPQADGQLSTGPEGTLRTGRQSNLNPRPLTAIATARVAGKQRAWGDTGRNLPPFEPPPEGIGVPVRGKPISLPPPPMPALAGVCGFTTGTELDQCVSIAYRLAPDGYLDGWHARETLAGLDGALPAGVMAAEYSGVWIGKPPIWPCDQEQLARITHLANRARANMRLPYALGVDATGVYQRVAMMPMKSCQLYVYTGDGGGVG